MKKIFFAAAFAVSLLTSHYSFAQTATPQIHNRQVRQQNRIGNGVSNGELTPREAGHLENREAKLQHDKRAAKSDGVVTGRERRHLRHEGNRDSKAIYRQKHDAQVAH